MATIKIVLDQRRAKNDETFPVVIRVRHLKKYFDVKTNYHTNRKKFDSRKEQIIGDMNSTNFLHDLKEEYSKRVREFLKENSNSTFDINVIKKYVLQKPAELTTVHEFWTDVIQWKKRSN
jgi:hypothetical protein